MNLRELLYGEGTEFDRNKGCFPQTHVKFLDTIICWVNNPEPSSPRVLVLFGQAGTGKSAIAHEIAHLYNCMNHLTTSYFFVRNNPSGHEPYRFFTTLAQDLCRISPAFRAALANIINLKPWLVHVRNYTTLVESLLQDPIKDLSFVGPVFIVIDALDENEDAFHKRLYAGRNSIPFHTALLQWISKLPSNFRILITSRPERELENTFSESSLIHRIYMDDCQLGDRVNDDVLIFMQTKLHTVNICENDLQKLVERAEGLFQWASVACDYIAHPPPGLESKDCIQRILHPSESKKFLGLNPLDELYTTVLERFNMNDSIICSKFQSVMKLILGVFKPLSVIGLNMMHKLGFTENGSIDISVIVKDLGSLLSHVGPSESELPITPLHTSFWDFLTDQNRSHDFFINMDGIHDKFTMATLQVMLAKLEFNICKLETSFCLNNEVADLKERIEKYIPSALSYSCHFWADHLASMSNYDSDIFKLLQIFMEEKFLFWLEVLSVKGELAIAKPALLVLQKWLSQISNPTNVSTSRSIFTYFNRSWFRLKKYTP